MSVYIKTSDGRRFFLDAWYDRSYDQTGSVTKYAVDSGFKSSDHYSQEPDSVKISGSVGLLKSVSNGRETTDYAEFEQGLTSLKKSGEFFSVSFSDNLDILDNCLFTSLSMSQNLVTGRYTTDVNIVIEQVIVSDAVTVDEQVVAIDQFKDTTESKKSASGTTLEPTKEEQRKLFATALRNLSGER